MPRRYFSARIAMNGGTTNAFSAVRISTVDEERERAMSRQRQRLMRERQRVAGMGRGLLSLHNNALERGEITADVIRFRVTFFAHPAKIPRARSAKMGLEAISSFRRWCVA